MSPWLLTTGESKPNKIAPLYNLGSNFFLNFFKDLIEISEPIFPKIEICYHTSKTVADIDQNLDIKSGEIHLPSLLPFVSEDNILGGNINASLDPFLSHMVAFVSIKSQSKLIK